MKYTQEMEKISQLVRLRDDRVLVKRDVVPEKSSGGIIIPPSAQEEKKTVDAKGVIFALGPGVNEDEHGNAVKTSDANYLRVGDHISFGEYSGTDFIWDEHGITEKDDFIVMRANDIAMVLSKI